MNPNELRRARKRTKSSPRGVGELFTGLNVAQFHPQDNTEMEGRTMKAKCKRLADRSVLVGSTNFAFNHDGICEVKPNGRGNFITDFNTLLRMNGVSEVKDEEKAKAVAPVAVVVEAPKEEAPLETTPEVVEEVEVVSEEKEEIKQPRWKRNKKRTKKEND